MCHLFLRDLSATLFAMYLITTHQKVHNILGEKTAHFLHSKGTFKEKR